MKKLGLLTGVFLLCCLSSCVEQQNFEQYDEVAVTPLLEAALLYLETPESEINRQTSPSFVSTTFDFEAFSEQFVAEGILEGSLIYQLENTTSKPLQITLEFLDASGQVLDTETFLMDPAPTAILNREVVYGPAGIPLEILTNTAALRVSGTNLGDQTSVSGEPEPRFVLRSTAKFRISLT
jgi:hypothetical protein